MPEKIRIDLPDDDSTTALAYPAAQRRGVTLILGHGAGASQSHAFMVGTAEALAERGIDVVTFNFSYTEHGRRVPDANDRLEACYAAVVERIRGDSRYARGRIAIGGKSMGGRIATQIAAKGLAKPDAI